MTKTKTKTKRTTKTQTKRTRAVLDHASASVTKQYAQQRSTAAKLLGALGGAAGTGAAKRRDVDYAAMGRSSWKKLDAAERSRIMKQRRAGGAAPAAPATLPKLAKIKTLGELRALAEMDPRYAALAIAAAANLGGRQPMELDAAMRWLNMNADETTEPGVVKEVNFCR